jgi:uncharacterized protein with PQ loop repeat
MEADFAFICGALGNILFGFKSSFQVAKSYRKKNMSEVSSMMLLCDFGGNVACAYYIFANTGFTLFWQYINYGFATLFLIILFIMKYIYRGNKDG